MRIRLVGIFVAAGLAAGGAAMAQERVRASHVLLDRGEKEIAQRLLDGLLAGTVSWQDAVARSLDVMTKRADGDLGFFSRRDRIDEKVRSAAFTLQPGEIYRELIETQFGLHILRVTAREGQDAVGVTPDKPAVSVAPEKPSLAMTISVDPIDADGARPCTVALTVENSGTEAVEVYRPELWPLGLTFTRVPPAPRMGEMKAAYAEGLGAPALVTLGVGQSMTQKINLWDIWDSLNQEGWWEIGFDGGAMLKTLAGKLDALQGAEGYGALAARWGAVEAAGSPGFDLRTMDKAASYYVVFTFRNGADFLVKLDQAKYPSETAHFLRLVRRDFYRDKRLDKFVENEFIAGGGLGPEGLGWAEEATFIAAPKLDSAHLTERDFILVARQKRYSYEGGSHFMIALADLPGYTRTGLPIGRVVGKWSTIEDMATTAAWAKQRANPIASVRLFTEEALEARWKREIQAVREIATPKGPLPRATIETDQGTIAIELYEDDAPNTVASFVHLAERNFYEGLRFHRIVPGFVIQGGDPLGTGAGGPGYNIRDEVNARKHAKGAVAMAKTPRPDSAGSQFYICLDVLPHLDEGYTVFGQVVEGMDVVEAIVNAKAGKMAAVTITGKRDHAYVPEKLNEQK